MRSIARFLKGSCPPLRRRCLTLIASLLLASALSGFAQTAAEKASKAVAKKEPQIKEELTLKNGDKLTGQLLNSTGTEIKFKSDLAGEVTVEWSNVKELKSAREFAVIPKDVKNARESAAVPQGAIKIGEKEIIVSPMSTSKPDIETKPAATAVKPETAGKENTPTQPATAAKEATPAKEVVASKKVAGEKEVPTSRIAFVVDDVSYQKEIHRKIDFGSGWDGHITTGTAMIYSTQNSYLFQVDTALKRTLPTVSWLDPKLRTTFNFTLSAGKTTQVGDPTTVTNIYHLDAERDEYFSKRGYYLQALSFDHNFAQGLVLQQNYGAGVGATLLKKKGRELDITADLHYESQQFNATADVSELNLHLIGSTLTEAYTRKWGKLQFDEKFLADIAWNNWDAFSATGTSSVRWPVYKNLGFSVATIDNFLNNPQVGYKKNSFQLTTGFVLNLH